MLIWVFPYITWAQASTPDQLNKPSQMTGISYKKPVQHSFTEIFDLLENPDWELSKHNQVVTDSAWITCSPPLPSHLREGARPWF